MLPLLEPFYLPVIRAEYNSLNLVLDGLVRTILLLINCLDLLPQDNAFKCEPVVCHLFSKRFLCSFSVIETLKLSTCWQGSTKQT
jgi:hypothetical protein